MQISQADYNIYTGLPKAAALGKELIMNVFTPVYEDVLDLLERTISNWVKKLYIDPQIRGQLDLLILIDINRQPFELSKIKKIDFKIFGFRSISFISYPKFSLVLTTKSGAPKILKKNLLVPQALNYYGKQTLY